jgi:hypothetical protein
VVVAQGSLIAAIAGERGRARWLLIIGFAEPNSRTAVLCHKPANHHRMNEWPY